MNSLERSRVHEALMVLTLRSTGVRLRWSRLRFVRLRPATALLQTVVADRLTEGRTDGQNYDTQDRASIAASRGKNSPVNDCRIARVNALVLLRNCIRLISHKDATSCSPRKCLIS